MIQWFEEGYMENLKCFKLVMEVDGVPVSIWRGYIDNYNRRFKVYPFKALDRSKPHYEWPKVKYVDEMEVKRR